ncbi:NUDIX hydrolase [Janibacter massiliensis]|uniref:NUDIX hydrolase n=1 Tax=Janibacter massiliensis TaxID=2058291 RepID=UPI0018FE2077|nr:NUDIX domain-containing protein [Janibacter massiliensis]
MSPVWEVPVVGVAAVRDRALAWLEAPGEPVAIREAATVMLLREVEDALEVFVLRRVPQMEFAPSVHVFPGGGIEAVDRDATARFADRGSSDAAARVAAVREVAEECGVRLDPSSLVPRARWLTPDFEVRRYDTWFYAAAMPEGQEAVACTTEAELGGWVRPADLLAAADAGEAMLLEPTRHALGALDALGSVAAVLADRPRVERLEPVLVAGPDGPVVRTVLP